MTMKWRISVIKYFMLFFNFLFCLSGFTLIVFGGIIWVKYVEHLRFINSVFDEAVLFLVFVGAVLFVIGIIGCHGVALESHCMITTFVALLAIIYIFEIAAGVLVLILKKNVEEALLRDFNSYQKEGDTGRFYDWLQTELKCCGYNGPSDSNKEVPDICKTYREGCRYKLGKFAQENLLLVGGIGTGFAFLQLLSIVFTFSLMKEIKARNKYKDLKK